MKTIPFTLALKRIKYLGINQWGERIMKWKLQNIAEDIKEDMWM